MKAMRKRGICMILAGVMLVAGISKTSKTAELEGTKEITVNGSMVLICAAYATKCNVKLSISGGKAQIHASVSGYIDVSKIHAKIVLQKYSDNSWKAIKTYEDAVSSPTYSLSKRKVVSKGKYRVKAVFTIYKGAKSENVTKYSNTVSYSS